ncbi:class I SAM-dependent methyltransferase [Compostibacter hankyongensis]|uniref:Class I SAM-dependent methyltransferase n=1 Tax=Compostibacter hankyongensis TaxID=1007089 RepID=A0ABP8G2D6_9BACT
MPLIHRHHCPLCHSESIHPALKARDHTVSGKIFSIWHCDACTGRFTQDAPDEAESGKYYQSEAYISHSDTRKGIINRLYHIARGRAMQQKKHWVTRYSGHHTGALLDIGCGTGAFLATMKQAGWQVTGIEPDETARKNALALHRVEPLTPDALFSLPDGAFRVITLWHVLEHVHALHEYMDEMLRLLQPGGTLFLALPNFTAADALYYKADWAAYDVPRHLYHFSPAALASLAGQQGFRVGHQIPMPFDAFYISLLSEKYRHGHTRLPAGFLQGLRSWLHARKYPARSSSLTYVLRPSRTAPSGEAIL